jgi:hypothetical protein
MKNPRDCYGMCADESVRKRDDRAIYTEQARLAIANDREGMRSDRRHLG